MNPGNKNHSGKTTLIPNEVYVRGKNKGKPKNFLRVPDYRDEAWAEQIAINKAARLKREAEEGK